MEESGAPFGTNLETAEIIPRFRQSAAPNRSGYRS